MDVVLPDFSRANCQGADPEAFFSEGNITMEMNTARRVCAACEIVDACAEWAIHFEGDGIWGGLLPSERRDIRRTRGITLQTPHLKYVTPVSA